MPSHKVQSCAITYWVFSDTLIGLHFPDDYYDCSDISLKLTINNVEFS